MTTAVSLFGGAKLPAFVTAAAPSALAKSLAGGGDQGKRLSFKGGTFRLMVDGQQVAAIEERYLDVVIVNAAAKIGRTFYASAYDADNKAAPDCWSADGERPDATVKVKENARCADCPQNQKGSGQGESKACRYSQRIALVLASDLEGHVMQAQLPATSIFGREEGDNRPLQAYARFLGAQNVSPDMVITRLKFDTSVEHPKLFFKPMRWLTEEEYAIAQEQGQTEDALKAITMTVAAMDGVGPAAPLEVPGTRPGAAGKPQPRAGVAARAEPKDDEEPPAPPPRIAKKEEEPPAPAPRRGRPPKAKAEESAEPTEPEPEPAVRAAPRPAAPSAKPSLAKMAAEWDDEE
jgi:hypothetical protein